MALVQVNSSSNGDFNPIVKYDARAGRIFRVDKDDSGSTPVDITHAFRAVFDFEMVEVGWIRFVAGAAPDFVMARLGEAPPARPSEDHRQGARIHIKLAKECGGDVREFAGTAQAWLRAINALHDDYLAEAPANPGKLPIVAMKGDPLMIESGSGSKRSTNYQPVWTIVGWAPRPADMPLKVARNGANGNGVSAPTASRPPAASSTVVSSPAAVTTLAQAVSDDFG